MGLDSIKTKIKVAERHEQPKHKVVMTSYHYGDKASRREIFFGTILGAAFATLVTVLFFTFVANGSYIKKNNKAINLPGNDAPVSFRSIDSFGNIKTIGKIDPAGIEAEIRSQIAKIGTYNSVYAAAEKKFGVPRHILAAVHFVESHQSGDTDRKSYAGAQGPMQFMPSTFEAYAVDGDGDGKKLITDVHDAIFSAAKHLAANGAADGRVAASLYNYNHSYDYVIKVLAVAKNFGYTK